MPVYRLPENYLIFPHPLCADPSGVLAVGGDLTPARLELAYTWGVFPWYDEDQPILWWHPDPRAVLLPDDLRVSKSLTRTLKKNDFRITFNHNFREVVENCRTVERKGQSGTWIHTEITHAYCDLHSRGMAHSVEVWREEELVGGLYGVALGKVFFGESMFSLESDASKVALVKLVAKLREREFMLIDCQQDTPHMRSLGATLMSAEAFHQVMIENQKYMLSGEWYVTFD